MNAQWANRWLEQSFNRQDMEALRKLYHPDVHFQDVTLNIDSRGWAEVARFLGTFFTPAAGRHLFHLVAYLGNAKEGVVEWVWKGQMNKLDLFQVGRQTPGQTFSVRGNSVFRFNDAGLVIEERDYWDAATVRAQLLASPPV